MAHLLDLPNELLSPILEEVTYEKYGVKRPLAHIRPLLTTCRCFYQLLLPHIYGKCGLNFAIATDVYKIKYNGSHKDEMFGLWQKYGRYIRTLSIDIQHGVTIRDRSMLSSAGYISIPATIEALLPSFSNLTSAHFANYPQTPVVLIFEGVRVVLTECLYLQELRLLIDHHENSSWEWESHHATLSQLEAVDVSKPYAHLKKFDLNIWTDERFCPGSNVRFLEAVTRIVDPSLSTVIDFELGGRMNNYHGEFDAYQDYMPCRLWKVPAATSLSIDMFSDALCTLNQYILLYPSQIRQLKLARDLTTHRTGDHIVRFASSFPNLEFLDLPIDKLVHSRGSMEISTLLKRLKATLPKLERVRFTVGSIGDMDLEYMLGKEIVEGYKLTCGSYNLGPTIERRWLDTVAIYL
ncbi:hypothetical protein TWF281_011690 [Arthrobotrys megalospora]